MKLAMERFNHYPELQNNILCIIYNLLGNVNLNASGNGNGNNNSVGNKSDLGKFKKFTDIIDILSLNSLLDIYRCKLRSHAKDINFYHLNILYLFSQTFYKLPLEEKKPYLKDIAISISLFFDKNNKRYNDFKNRKLLEIQTQDLILRIINILTREKNCCYVLLDCDFFNDLINYLNTFCSNKNDKNDNISTSKSQSDYKSLKSIKNQGFLSYVIDKKKRKMNPDSIKKYLTGIILNILNIIYNISNQEGEDIYNKFTVFVNK
jgi:hypothetical protein